MLTATDKKGGVDGGKAPPHRPFGPPLPLPGGEDTLIVADAASEDWRFLAPTKWGRGGGPGGKAAVSEPVRGFGGNGGEWDWLLEIFEGWCQEAPPRRPGFAGPPFRGGTRCLRGSSLRLRARGRG